MRVWLPIWGVLLAVSCLSGCLARTPILHGDDSAVRELGAAYSRLEKARVALCAAKNPKTEDRVACLVEMRLNPQGTDIGTSGPTLDRAYERERLAAARCEYTGTRTLCIGGRGRGPF